MGRRRKPIIWGLDKAVGYQRAVHKLLIAMGFVPLPILRLLQLAKHKVHSQEWQTQCYLAIQFLAI